MPAERPSLSAVIVTRDAEALLRDCLRSLVEALDETGAATELIVIDNDSHDGTAAMMAQEFPEVPFVEMRANTGFPAAVNAGIERTTGDWIVLLNNDATIEREALRRVFDQPIADDVGTIAMQMRFAARPDLVNSAGLEVDVLGVAYDRLLGEPIDGEAARPADVFGGCGGAVLYRRAMLDDIGGMDSRIFLYLDDVDVAWRARMAGWRAIYTPDAVVWHHHSATTAQGSPFKYFHVGRNRVRVLARNADRSQLLRYGPAILLHELAYITFVAVADRTLAPVRGRIAGAREWRAMRAEGAALRRPVELRPRRGIRAALGRRRAWQVGGTDPRGTDRAGQTPSRSAVA